jgi:hypothetical protein
VEGVVDHLGGRILRPGHGRQGGEVGGQDDVGVGLHRADNALELGEVAGDGLIEYRQRQVHRRRPEELAHRHDLAARHAGQIGHDALDLLDVLPREPGLRLLQRRDAPVDPLVADRCRSGLAFLCLGCFMTISRGRRELTIVAPYLLRYRIEDRRIVILEVRLRFQGAQDRLGFVQRLADDADQRVDLGVGDDQRRAADDAVADGADHQAVADAQVADDRPGLAFLVEEAMVGALLADDLDGADQAQRAGLADQRVVVQRGQRLGQIGAGVVAGALDQALALQDLDVLQRHGGAGRVARIGEAVDEVPALLLQLGDDEVGHAHGRNRQVAGRQALGHGDHVGLHAVVLVAEPLAQPPEAADHLVADQQDAVLAAHGLDRRPVAVGRDDHPARPLDRLADEGRDVLGADLQDLVLDLLTARSRKAAGSSPKPSPNG